ncbi:hypothetical protein, partial [Amycolatopsis rubida]|uniref:hypothetical protein n=1 Tax=Amycolatopsis rubida TaxID=112413 RepID=UPI0019405032
RRPDVQSSGRWDRPAHPARPDQPVRRAWARQVRRAYRAWVRPGQERQEPRACRAGEHRVRE